MNKKEQIEEILKRHLIIPWGKGMVADTGLIEELLALTTPTQSVSGEVGKKLLAGVKALEMEEILNRFWEKFNQPDKTNKWGDDYYDGEYYEWSPQDVRDWLRKELLVYLQPTKDRDSVIDEVEKLLIAELLIAQKEGQPTSRLTSLAVGINALKTKQKETEE